MSRHADPIRIGSLIPLGNQMLFKRPPGRAVMGFVTNETRPPLKGEWYASGAIPCAWQAPDDLGTSYRIVRLVETEAQTRLVVVGMEVDDAETHG